MSYDVEIKKRRRQSEDALDPLFDRSIYSAAEVGVQGFEVPNLMHAYGVSGSGNHAHVDDPFSIHAQDVHEQQMMDDLQDDVIEFFGSIWLQKCLKTLATNLAFSVYSSFYE